MSGDSLYRHRPSPRPASPAGLFYAAPPSSRSFTISAVLPLLTATQRRRRAQVTWRTVISAPPWPLGWPRFRWMIHYATVFGEWKESSRKSRIMTLDRRVPVHALLLSPLLIVTGCSSGDDALMRQAKEECAARGLDLASKAYGACVDKRSNELYEYWARKLKTVGD